MENVSPAARWRLPFGHRDVAKTISTRDLRSLPDVARLRDLLQSLAMLDAIFSPEWQSRYYSFNSRWSEGEQMGSMRDGCGDDFFALFNAAGCFLKGFAHEAPMRESPRVFHGVPAEFAVCLEEPAFNMDNTTFCIWRRYSDEAWQRRTVEFPAGGDPDGSSSLLSALDGRPDTYRTWAESYYEREVELAAVEHVYRHLPITPDVVARLNSEVSLNDLAADISEIGYPG